MPVTLRLAVVPRAVLLLLLLAALISAGVGGAALGQRLAPFPLLNAVTLPEAAAALDIPLGTAKSRLHRALAAMRIPAGLEDRETSSPVTQGRYA